MRLVWIRTNLTPVVPEAGWCLWARRAEEFDFAIPPEQILIFHRWSRSEHFSSRPQISCPEYFSLPPRKTSPPIFGGPRALLHPVQHLHVSASSPKLASHRANIPPNQFAASIHAARFNDPTIFFVCNNSWICPPRPKPHRTSPTSIASLPRVCGRLLRTRSTSSSRLVGCQRCIGGGRHPRT